MHKVFQRVKIQTVTTFQCYIIFFPGLGFVPTFLHVLTNVLHVILLKLSCVRASKQNLPPSVNI